MRDRKQLQAALFDSHLTGAGGAGSEVWNRVYMIAPVKKFGRVRLSTIFLQNKYGGECKHGGLWLSGPGSEPCGWRGGPGTMQPILQSRFGASSLTWLTEFGIRLHGWLISASLRFAPSLIPFLSCTLYTLRVSEDPVCKVNYIEHSLTVVAKETLHWNSGRHFRDLGYGAGFGKTKNILMRNGIFFKKKRECEIRASLRSLCRLPCYCLVLITLGTRGFFSRPTGSFVSSAAGGHVFLRRPKTRGFARVTF